jgi:DNA polymerase III alpha subunit
MVARPSTDQFHRSQVTETDVCGRLMADPTWDYASVSLLDAERYNAALAANHSTLPKLASLEDLGDLDPRAWHARNQAQWFMPGEYRDMDIVKWVLERCKDQDELQRAGQELLEYADRDLLDMLRYLKYLVDTMRSNKIVWGVGRGSSVASFVLYVIGVHRMHSLRHDLDFHEFMR